MTLLKFKMHVCSALPYSRYMRKLVACLYNLMIVGQKSGNKVFS